MQVSVPVRSSLKWTGQIISIDIRVFLQIAHDSSVFVPGIHQANGGDSRRCPIYRNNVVMLINLRAKGYSIIHPLSNIRMTINPLSGIQRHAYRSQCQCMRILARHLENLESNRLASVPTLPNFDHLGDMLGIVSLPHDTPKFRPYCYCIVATTRRKKSRGAFPPPWVPMREPLGRE